jgi:hypothetical protein
MNPLFANIRDTAVRFGYQYSSEASSFWRDYCYLPLLTLERILSGKVIPYLDNWNSLYRLLERNSSAALPLRFIINNVRANHVFHESAHCVAHSVFSEHECDLTSIARSGEERLVIQMIAAEAFANTVETLGILQDKSIEHLVFYRLNSHMVIGKRKQDILTRSGGKLGDEVLFMLLLLSFFRANLTKEAIDDAVCRKIMNVAGCDDGRSECARQVIALGGDSLSHVFRGSTTPAYMAFLGYKEQYEGLVLSDNIDRRTWRDLILSPLFQIISGKQSHINVGESGLTRTLQDGM